METSQSYSNTNGISSPNWLEIAKTYLEYGFSLVPVDNQKKPLFQWKKYQIQKTTIEEVEKWFHLDNFAGLAVVTGSISGVLVLDIDNGADTQALDLPITPIVKTPHNGLHYYFKYPKDKTIRNYTGFRSKIDLRGEGGLAILPPTTLLDSEVYQWLKDLTTPLVEVPEWLLKELEDKPISGQLTSEVLNGVPKSKRNTSATQVIGKFLKHFKVKDWESVAWPALKGWNLQNQPPLEEKELRQVFESIVSREISQKNQKEEILGFVVEFENTDRITLKKEGFEYAIFSNKGYKLDIAIYKDGQLLNRDNLLVTSSKSRTTFVKHCQIDDKNLSKLATKHLVEIIQVLDEIDSRQIKQSKNTKPESLTDTETQEATQLLKSPTLFYDILQFIKKLGVIGEEKTALTHYIVFTSRITDEPLSEIVKGESAVGKSYVVGKIMLVFPKDSYRDLTDATAQSFYYVTKDYFAHKIIIIFEKHGSEKTDYSIRSLQSEKKLKLQVTIKDPETNQFVTSEKEVDGPVGFISTTTQARIHNENETRVLSIYPDESKQQTERILEISDFKYRGLTGPTEVEIKKWQNLQKVLKPYPVLIPFVEEIRKVFPKKPVRVRRDYTKFLSILSVVTLLHQEQREKKTIGEKEYLTANLTDFYIAKTLFEETLQKTIYEIPPKSEFLINKAKDLTSGALDNFSISELARYLDWEYDVTWKWFKPAYHKGFFIQTEEQKGSKGGRYKPSAKDITQTKILPETEELYELNKDWSNKTEVYDPLTGEILSFKDLTCTDVLMNSEET